MRIKDNWIYLNNKDLRLKSLNMLVEEMAKKTGVTSLKRYHVRSVDERVTIAIYSDEELDPHFANLEEWQEDSRLFFGWTVEDYQINDEDELKIAKQDVEKMLKLPKHPDLDYNIELYQSSIEYYEEWLNEEKYTPPEVPRVEAPRVEEPSIDRQKQLGKNYLEMMKELEEDT